MSALDVRAVERERDRRYGIDDELVPRRLSPVRRSDLRESFGVGARLAIEQYGKRRAQRVCDHCGFIGGQTLQPLDGLFGKFECRNVGACERRILAGAVR